jgi:hypothetical protein
MRHVCVLVFSVLCTVLLVSTVVFASPFIVCDPQTGVTFYKVTGPAWVPTGNITAQTDGSIKMDIATATVGSNSLNFRACNMWGTIENCSTASPFTFTRPSVPQIPANFKLEQ